MFKFLLFLLIIGVLGFFVLGALFGRVIRFFGSGNTSNNNRRTTNRQNTRRSEPSDSPQKKFSKEEGEYVNYEEVRDDD
ncbi:MAG: DUF4834 family protein [Dysgonomonas sp.]|nr:DUF4834 family protein [Dysgonomonas sp.]